MAQHNIQGEHGEHMAARYLEEQGYQILEMHWRLGHLEADIIALKDNMLVLVEVKTRKSDEYGEPESFIDKKKRQACVKLANAYVKAKQRTEEVRIDVVSIVLSSNGCQINHIPNAINSYNLR